MKQILVFFILLSFSVQAQSKKKINEDLKLQLNHRKEFHDSILNMGYEVNKDYRKLSSDIRLQEVWTKNTINYCRVYLKFIDKNEEALSGFKHNSDTVISKSEAENRYQKVNKSSLKVPDSLLHLKLNLQHYIPDSLSSTMKLKEQNRYLLQEIHAYDSIIAINSINIERHRRVLNDFATRTENLKLVKNEYEDLMNLLYQKLDATAAICHKMARQKRDDDRKKRKKVYEDELKLMNKKQRRGTLAFIPPVVVDDFEESYLPENIPYTTQSDAVKLALENSRDHIEIPEMKPTNQPKEEVILDFVEEPAEYPGGPTALKEFLKTNIQLPAQVSSGEVSGRVILKFLVSKTGSISNITVVRTIPNCKDCEVEALRLISIMPNWIPGKNNGKVVNQWFNLPISFKAK